MLKIKDNVDLKELEKYGFEYDFISNNYLINVDDKEANKLVADVPEWKEFCFLQTYDDTREINLYFQDMEDYYSIKLDILYDLIKADLVEKVE